jgi:hypothetical protein
MKFKGYKTASLLTGLMLTAHAHVAQAGYSAGTFTLTAGRSISAGTFLLAMQTDGNLVAYQNGQAVWASSFYTGFSIPRGHATSGLNCAGCYAVFQGDGNLVLYNGSEAPYWATMTAGFSNAVLNVSAAPPYVYVSSAQGSLLWSSGKLIVPKSPLVVDSTSSVVVMEYEAWFTAQSPLSSFSSYYTPILTSAGMSSGYNSEDPNVIAQHMAWLQSMGVNAITAEQTNGGPCMLSFSTDALCSTFLARIGNPGQNSAYETRFQSIDNSTFNLYPALAANGTNIKIIPVLDAQDPEMYSAFNRNGALTTAIQEQLAAYAGFMDQYPQLSVIYQGKPLVILYLGGSQEPTVPGSVFNLAKEFAANNQGGFTFRLMASEVGSQPQLLVYPGVDGLSVVNPSYSVWSWVERLNPSAGLIPSYTTMGPRVESFEVASATPGTIASNPWGSPDAGLYDGGQYITLGLKDAQDLKPTFLIVDGFNEYGTPDQGWDENHSNDIEPTQQWGYDRFNLVKSQLLNYENAVGPALGGHP